MLKGLRATIYNRTASVSETSFGASTSASLGILGRVLDGSDYSGRGLLLA